MRMSLPGDASGRRGARTPVAFALIYVTATLAAPMAAQDPEPGPTFGYPQPSPSACPPGPRPIEPSPQDRMQARELASAARQSVILGDLDQAHSLLLRAVRLDPTAPDVPYYLARVLDDQGQREQALAEYCRTLALGAPPDEAAFARERIEALTDQEEVQVPDDGIAEERRILDDAVVRSRSTGPLRRRSAPGVTSPTTAFTLGMLIPGLGQYYSGKPVRGAVVASLAMGALASGVFVQKRSVGCLEPVGSGERCLPDDIVHVKMSRPYLATGIAVAGSVALLGALDAYFGAREQREGRGFTEARGSHVEGPSISSRDGITEISFTVRTR